MLFAGIALPTATHLDALAQDTPVKLTVQPNGSVPLGMTDHRLPFHTSANEPVSVPPSGYERPTATQRVVETQETALKESWLLDLGPLAADQVLPSQVSMSGCVCCPSKAEPTATQCVSEMHDTPASDAFVLTYGFAVSDHSFPFHASVNANRLVLPTATQCFALGHATALRKSPESATGLGVTDHAVGVGDSEGAANATVAVDTARLAARTITKQRRLTVCRPVMLMPICLLLAMPNAQIPGSLMVGL